MTSAPPAKKNLLSVLVNTLLPWARKGHVHIFMAQPPFEEINGMSVTPGEAPLLKMPRLRYASPRSYYWPETGVNAVDKIYFGCVLRGEADIRIGVTERMAASDERLRGGPGYYVMKVQAHDMFVIPPGVPVSDGFRPHWERADEKNAQSEIFWINLRMQGASIHTCQTLGAGHSNSGAIYIADSRLLMLGEMLGEELSKRLLYSTEIAQSLLLTLLQRMAQGHIIGEDAIPLRPSDLEEMGTPAQTHLSNQFTTTQVVQQACRYIRTYYDKPLKLEDIAAHSFVSATHLNRLFRAELNTTVMKFMLRCRIEAARSLLSETNCSAREVSQCVGFAHPSHLSQVFAREVGMTPTQFRLLQCPDKDSA